METKDEIRKRIGRNLEEIQKDKEALSKCESATRDVRKREIQLGEHMNTLRDQVKKDLTALDPGLTS